MKRIIRILAAVLAAVLVLPFPTAAATSFTPNGTQIQFVKNLNNDYTEIAQHNGASMYFHDTSTFTLSIITYPNGKVEIAKYTKTTNSLNQTVQDINVLTQYTSNTALVSTDFFQDIEYMVNNNQLILEDNLNNELYAINSSSRQSEAEIAQMIDTALIAEYGSPYSHKFLTSMHSQGYSAYLYETMSFERYKHYSWFLNAGSTLGAIASLLALPQSKVLLIMTFVGTAATGYSLYADVTSNKYVANVYYNKIVEINGISPYSAGKTIYGHCYTGDKAAAYVSGNTTMNSDFNDNVGLLETGLQNYITYYG